MTTLLLVLSFHYFQGISSTSQTLHFTSMEQCEKAKAAMTDSVMQFKNLESFHVGCYAE